MKSILIALISMSMVFPATIFAGSKSASKVVSSIDLRSNISRTAYRLKKEGWETKTIQKSSTKIERQMINQESGLAVKIVSIKRARELRFLVAVFKDDAGHTEDIFKARNQLGYKRFTIGVDRLRSKGLKVRTNLDNAMKSLESEIKIKLMARGQRISFVSKLFNLIVPSAHAGKLSEYSCYTLNTLLNVVAFIIIGIYFAHGAIMASMILKAPKIIVYTMLGVAILGATAIFSYLEYRTVKDCKEIPIS